MIIVDPNAFFGVPDANTLRPASAGVGPELEIPFGAEPPYVEIDLDEPGVTNSFLNVAELNLPGNVALVSVSIKINDDSPTWDSTAELTVNPATGNVILPSSWHTGDDDTVPIGKIRIEPVTPIEDTAETFYFKVDLMGCFCGVCKYNLL